MTTTTTTTQATTPIDKLPECWRDAHDALNAGLDRVILFGPAGTGKTFAGLKYGLQPNTNSERLICTAEMTGLNLFGGFMPASDGTFQWQEGAVLKAWQGNGTHGGRLVVDEIDKASGDIEGELLSAMDSRESARWTHPVTNEVISPREFFSVVMTTNIEEMSDLPMALKDRFPVAIRIDSPHPDALQNLPFDLRAICANSVNADARRRYSIRSFMAYAKLRETLGAERSARLVFGRNATDILDAIAIATGAHDDSKEVL